VKRARRTAPRSPPARPHAAPQFVEGLGGFIDEDNMRMPEDPAQMGVTLRAGAVVRVDRPRRDGGTMWQTSSEAASAWARSTGDDFAELNR